MVKTAEDIMNGIHEKVRIHESMNAEQKKFVEDRENEVKMGLAFDILDQVICSCGTRKALIEILDHLQCVAKFGNLSEDDCGETFYEYEPDPEIAKELEELVARFEE